MIRINLLPKDMRPVQRTPLPHIMSLLVLVAVLMFMGNVFVNLQGELRTVERKIEKSEKELAGLADVVKEYDVLTKQKLLLQRKIVAIQDILKGRTIWSEQLLKLTTLTPDNIWYKRIRMVVKKFSEEKPVLDKKTGKPVMDPKTGLPKMAKVPVEKQVLEISGYAIDDESGVSSTSTLAAQTTGDELFSSIFSLYTSKIEDTDFNGYPVREFTFEYLIGS